MKTQKDLFRTVVTIDERVYILSKRNIYPGDWYYSENENIVLQSYQIGNHHNCYKIEQTNDKVLIQSGVKAIKKSH